MIFECYLCVFYTQSLFVQEHLFPWRAFWSRVMGMKYTRRATKRLGAALMCLGLIGGCEASQDSPSTPGTLSRLRWRGPSNWAVTAREVLPGTPRAHHIALAGGPHARVWIQHYEGRVSLEVWVAAWSRARGATPSEKARVRATILGEERQGRAFEYTARRGADATLWREVLFHVRAPAGDVILATRAPVASWGEASAGFEQIWSSLSWER